MKSHTRAGEVLTKVKQRFPRRDGTDQWNLQKMHGAFKMSVSQICRHGSGDGWDSQYGERMHQHFFTTLGRNTQRRHDQFAPQLADRRFESITIETASNAVSDQLISWGKSDDDDDDEVDNLYEEGFESQRDNVGSPAWNYHDANIPLSTTFLGSGRYAASASAPLNETGDNSDNHIRDYDVTWKDRNRQALDTKVDRQLLYALSAHAKTYNWLDPFSVIGFTSISKPDVTTGKDITYRSNPNYRGTKWQDWGLFLIS